MLLSFHTLTFTAFVFTQLTFGHPPSHALTFIAFPFTQLAFSHFYHLLIFRLYYLCHYTISLYPLWSSLPLHLHKNLLIYFTFITEIHWLLFGLSMNQTTIPFIPKTFLSLLIILLSSFKTKKKPFLFSQTKKFKLGTCSWL